MKTIYFILISLFVFSENSFCQTNYTEINLQNGGLENGVEPFGTVHLGTHEKIGVTGFYLLNTAGLDQENSGVVNTESYEGTHSLKIKNKEEGGSLMVRTQSVEVASAGTYLFGFWVKSKDGMSDTNFSGFSSLEHGSNATSPLGRETALRQTSIDTEWSFVYQVFILSEEKFNEGHKFMRFQYGLNKYPGETYFLDTFKVVKIEETSTEFQPSYTQNFDSSDILYSMIPTKVQMFYQNDEFTVRLNDPNDYKNFSTFGIGQKVEMITRLENPSTLYRVKFKMKLDDVNNLYLGVEDRSVGNGNFVKVDNINANFTAQVSLKESESTKKYSVYAPSQPMVSGEFSTFEAIIKVDVNEGELTKKLDKLSISFGYDKVNCYVGNVVLDDIEIMPINEATLEVSDLKKQFSAENLYPTVTIGEEVISNDRLTYLFVKTIDKSEYTDVTDIARYQYTVVLNEENQYGTASGFFEIEKKECHIIIASGLVVSYGDEINIQLQYDGLTGDDVDQPLTDDFIAPEIVITNNKPTFEVGSYLVRLQTNSAVSDYYKFIYPDASEKKYLEVTPRDLYVSGKDSISFTYGSNPPATLPVFYDGFLPGDNKDDLEEQPLATIMATSEDSVGFYPITIEGGVSVNYNFIYVEDSIEITKADLFVSIKEGQSSEYGSEFPAIELLYDGLKNYDYDYDLEFTPVGKVVIENDSLPGEYPITIIPGEAHNYNLFYDDSTAVMFEITKANVTITHNIPTELSMENALTYDFDLTSSNLTAALTVTSSDESVLKIEGNTIVLSKEGTVTLKITNEETATHFGKEEEFEVTVLGVEEPTAIQDELEDILIYPNPATNYIKVSNTVVKSLVVYNLIGNELKRFSNNLDSYDLSNLNQGYYFVMITTESAIHTKKIFIK